VTHLLAALPFLAAGLLTLTWEAFGSFVVELVTSVLVTVLVVLVLVGVLSAAVLELLEVDVRLNPHQTDGRA